MTMRPGRELCGFGLKGTESHQAPTHQQDLKRRLKTLVVDVAFSPWVGGIPLRDLRNKRFPKIVPAVEPGIA